VQNNTAVKKNGGIIFLSEVPALAENKKVESRGAYYTGKPRFSYNNDPVCHTHHFKAHETVQDMVKRAQQSMSDNQFNG
jgi:hypothetical protein